FLSAVRALCAEGAEAFVEVGPTPALLGVAQQCVDESESLTWVPTLRRGRAARDQLLDGLAQLYVAGVDPRWNAVHGEGCRRIAIPTYPFERKSFWDPANPRRAEGAAPRAPREAPSRTTSARRRLLEATPGEREGLVVEHLQRLVGNVLQDADSLGA